MLQIQKILFPTDFSACAERAFAHAAYLADRHDAELHVLHGVETYQRDDGVTYLMEEPVIADEEIAEQLRGEGGVRVVQVQARSASATTAILDCAPGAPPRRRAAAVPAPRRTGRHLGAADVPGRGGDGRAAGSVLRRGGRPPRPRRVSRRARTSARRHRRLRRAPPRRPRRAGGPELGGRGGRGRAGRRRGRSACPVPRPHRAGGGARFRKAGRLFRQTPSGGHVMIDKPSINRDEALRQDRVARHVREHLERACGLLNSGERLGEPFREGARIVLPVVQGGGSRDEGDVRGPQTAPTERGRSRPDSIYPGVPQRANATPKLCE